MLTADLVVQLADPVIIPSSYSPPQARALSTVGVIGQPHLSSPRHISRISHPPSTHYSSQPQTPAPNNLDLASLIGKTSIKSVGVIGEGLGFSNTNLRSEAHDFYPRFSTLGLNGDQTQMTFGHRRLDSEPWPLRPGNISISSPANQGEERSVPKSAPPLPLFQPFSDPKTPVLPPCLPVIPQEPSSRLNEITDHITVLGTLVGEVKKEVEDVEKVKHELDMCRLEWGKVEKERKRLETIVEQSELSAKEGLFNVILLDGDEYIFGDELLKEGYEGGQQAAQKLLESFTSISQGSLRDAYQIRSFDYALDDQQAGIEKVVIQVFLNKSILGDTLLKAGAILSISIFDSFWQGFSAVRDLITVIDVGTGKDAVETKIKGWCCYKHLHFYVKTKQCHTILFGTNAAHSTSTIANLNQRQLNKLVYLQMSDTSSSPTPTQFLSYFIPELWRINRPPSIPAPIQSFSAVVQSSAPVVFTSKPNLLKRQPPTGTGVRSAASLSAESSPTITVVELGSSNSTTSSDSGKISKGKRGRRERKAGNGGIGGGQALGNNNDRQAYQPQLQVEPQHQIQGEDEEGWMEAHTRKQNGGKRASKEKKDEKIKVASVRNLKPRPCHTFYLSPWGCKSGEVCDYSHEYDLTDMQLEELSKLAKEIICPYIKSNKCHFTDEECVYGHKCPRGGTCNFGDTCRFTILDNAHGELD